MCYISRFVLIVSMLFLSVVVPAQHKGVQVLSLADFGARPNDGLDDSRALQKLVASAQNEGDTLRILIPAGQFHFDKGTAVKNVRRPIHILGEKGSEIIIRDQYFLLLINDRTEVQLSKPVSRGDRMLKLAGYSTRLRKNDVLHIASGTMFESAWGYKENDLVRIQANEGEMLRLQDSLLFNYHPQQEKVTIFHYEPRQVTLQHLTITISPTSPAKRLYAISVTGFKVIGKNLVIRFKGGEKYFQNGLFLTACYDSRLDGIHFSGLQYGATINYNRNFTATDTYADNCRHAYAPTTASVNIYIKDIVGVRCQSVMDAHASFNVTYENVLDSLSLDYPNCRAWGTTIINARILQQASVPYKLYAYWSIQSFTKEYENYYYSQITRFKKVDFVAANKGRFNGLNSYQCQQLEVEDCTTHSVAYYGNQRYLKSIRVADSRIGYFLGFNNTVVKNTLFDGRIAAFPSAVMRLVGSGKFFLSNISVANYNADSTFLFDRFHNDNNANRLIIEGGEIQKLRAFTNQVVNSGKSYKNLEIKKVTFAGFTERLPAELSTAWKSRSE